MSAPVTPELSRRMSSDEFLAWSHGEDVGRVELIDGRVVSRCDRSRLYAITKNNINRAIDRGLALLGVRSRALTEGPVLRIDARSAYAPDVLVQGDGPPERPRGAAHDPVIAVEVLSRSGGRPDLGAKVAGYRRVPSLRHYLIVQPIGRSVIHHRRVRDHFETSLVFSGALKLDPPGLTLPIDAFWRDLPLVDDA